MSEAPFAPERLHTLHFLREIRRFSPVFLDTEVDMTRVLAHRAAIAERGDRYSTVTYVLSAVARALVKHPEANAAIEGRRVARYPAVHAKLALDKTINGRRVVLAGIVLNLQQGDLAEIQRKVEHFRDGDPLTMPEFGGARLLQRLPAPAGAALFRLSARSLRRRAAMFGTFALTSLGHRPVDGFHSVGGTTVTIGIGQVAERPVVRDGRIVAAPTMRLSLAFDHRVIDGAEAADLLADIKDHLEAQPPEPAVASAPRPAAAARAGSAEAADLAPVNDVEELKQYAVVHARAQNIPPAQLAALLDAITTDDQDTPGSWTGEWTRAAQALEARGRLLESSRHYIMARFPYVDGPARQGALEGATAAFERWAAGQPDLQRLDVDLPRGRVRCWTSGLTSPRPLPLLVVLGGIVSVKEQWAPVLLQARRMGMAGLVAELPGVGENTLRYDAESWRMLPGLLDAVADRADVAATYAIALSFSGHLALRCASRDRRIRGIVTAGAPVRDFFTDADWQRNLPRVTVDTLAHLTGIKESDFAVQLADWSLTDEELAAVDIPVYYAVSTRDEIIPAAEVNHLRAGLKDLHVVANDDVHGSPHHTAEMRLWTILSLLAARGITGGPQVALFRGLAAALQARQRLTGAGGPRQ